jgi:predicted O-linked N-acetylglucosamine transferase (SPINDLY family)
MSDLDGIVVFLSTGQFAEAEWQCRRRLSQAPRSPELLYLLGVSQLRQGRGDAALATFQRVLKLRPNFSDAINAKGAALEQLGRPAEASAAYRRVLDLTPTAPVWFNLGNACRRANDAEGALAAYGQACALQPDSATFLSALLGMKLRLCDWADLDRLMGRLGEAFPAGQETVDPFRSLSLDTAEPRHQSIARAYARRFGTPARLSRPAVARDRLSIGYLSADFQRHATAYLMAEFFELHDRSRFTVAAYSLAGDDGSDMRRRLRAGVDRFVDASGMDAMSLARRIAADGVDILVDLKGYTRHAMPAVMAMRPAPIQVQWLGYPGTMGAGFIDYILADGVVLPETAQPYYDEAIVRLPACYQVNDRKRPCPTEAPPRSSFGLPDTGLVLASFNDPYKLRPGVFQLWMDLLRQVDGATLWLYCNEPAAQRNLRGVAKAAGIDPARLVFAGHLPLDRHLARYHHVDLFLDTLPYNAHTTASDALWMACPVVTRRGNSFAGRVAASLLMAVGLADYVTSSAEDYKRVSLRLLRDGAERARIRRHLGDNRLSLPLFDTPATTRAVEAAYAQMWQRAVAGLDPAPFSV